MVLTIQQSYKTNKYKNSTSKDTTNLILQVLLIVLLYISTLYILDYTNLLAYDNNVFKMRLDSGAFRDTGVTTPLVQWVNTMVAKFFQNILPIMSIISTAAVVIVLICTVFYFLAQEYFDEVYLVKANHKSNKSGGGNGGKVSFKAMGQVIGQRDFFKIYCVPNIKKCVFSGATDETMTLGDFFKEKGLQCMLVFAFCITIGNQTLVDLFYQGGSIGAYFIEKLARDFDYVEIIDNTLSIGTDYKPQWDTSQIEGRNKSRVFDEVYKKLKLGTKTPATSSTEFKANMGQKLEAMIESGEAFKGVVWSHKSFIVSAEYLSTSVGGQSTPSRIYLPVTEFGYSPADNIMTGYIVVYITSEEEKFGTSVIMTTFQEAWTNVSPSGASIDLTKVGLKIPANATITERTGTAYINYLDGTVKSVDIKGNGSTISIQIPSVNNTQPKSIRIPEVKVTFSDKSTAKTPNSINYLFNVD